MAQAVGWRGAMLETGGACLVAAALLQPLRARFDRDRVSSRHRKCRWHPMTIRGGVTRTHEWLSGRLVEWAHRSGALPPMRITASWSRSLGSTEYKYVA